MKFMCLIVVSVLFFSYSTFAYQPPAGIPEPRFGINDSMPSRPDPWSVPVAGFYYIDNEAGVDNGRPYGTPAAPRKTIPTPVPAGSYVEIHGIYKSNGDIVISCNGNNAPWSANKSGPVWIVGQSWDERPSFSPRNGGTFFTGKWFYLRFIRFLTTSEGTLWIGNVWGDQDADYAMVKECEIVGDSKSNVTGISIGGDPSHPNLRYSNIIVYKCEIHDIGNMQPSSDVDACGITVDDNTDSVWFLENHIYNIAEHASRTGGAWIDLSNIDSTRYIYWGRNVVHHCLHSGFWVKYARDVIFSENIIHDINDSLYEYQGDATCIGAQYGPRRIWIINNRLYNSGGGVGIVGTDNIKDLPIYIIGNVIFGIRNPKVDYASSYSYSAISVRGGTECTIINNTIYRCGGGIYSAPFDGLPIISNNSIDSIIDPKGKHLNIVDKATCLNNNLFQNGNNLRISVGGETYTSITQFNNSSLADACISSNPAYRNLPAGDFSLSENSPLINKGSNATAEKIFRAFLTLYGIQLSTDIFGNPRLSGEVIDIGASEYDSRGVVSDKKINTITKKKAEQPNNFLLLMGPAKIPGYGNEYTIFSLLGRKIYSHNRLDAVNIREGRESVQAVVFRYLQ